LILILIMQKQAIQQKILRKLMSIKPAKWGASHTEEINLVKSLPGHLRGQKVTKKAIEELFKMNFLSRMKKTGEWHVSLNPRKKKEIFRFLEL